MSVEGSSLQYQRSTGSSSSSSLSEMSVDANYTSEFSVGMRPEIKQLYRPDDRSTWDEWKPGHDPDNIEANSHSLECALIVRHAPHPSNNNQVALYSITVQSLLVKKVLNRAFEGYEGLNTQLRQLTFAAPFHPFYYRWHCFEKLRRDEQDMETKKHLDLLYVVLSKEILPHIETMQDFINNKVISFHHLWTIFAPGMEIYTSIDGQDHILSLRESRYGASMSGEFFSLACRYIDYDESSRLGYVETSIEINSFHGVKKIVDLEAFPVHLHPSVVELTDRLYARGGKLESLGKIHHLSYSGFYTARSSKQARKRHVENGHIIIDPHAFNIHGMPGPNIEPFNISSHLMSAGDDPFFNGDYDVVYNATSRAFRQYRDVLVKYQKCSENNTTPHHKALSPRQRLLCTSIARGYCLTTKSWGMQLRDYHKDVIWKWINQMKLTLDIPPIIAEFIVENIGPICWSDEAFTRLVLPHGYKDIIHASVQEQLSRDDGFDDFIAGKGQGFIMLLSGDPGVGKTLTAESVAEEMHQPLYSMSAGELGETAAEVEDALDLVLELASRWNAILLLDECDVFLEARTTADIRRNRLISTFLKKLEYYNGIMFLTTNRLNDIDAAFESRIHLIIHYPALNVTSRLHIWKTFIHGINRVSNMEHGDRAGDSNPLSDLDLESLAVNHQINGRQIKNVIKMAHLLSKQQKVALGLEHIEMVLRVRKGDFR